jgi:hypothetical protein
VDNEIIDDITVMVMFINMADDPIITHVRSHQDDNYAI